MTPAPQKEYIITDDMLTICRHACLRANIRNTENLCRDCEFNNLERHTCDFDDNDVEKLFRSRPYTSASSDVLEGREKLYRQLMAASINNENPGWVQIADIEKILKPFDEIAPDIENLQEFPFRSYPKKELHQQTKER
jgi:glutathionylspermidine synthase